MALFDFLRRKRRTDRLLITDDGVRRFRPDGLEESVRWEDLAEVGVITTSEGPFVEDVFWILIAQDGKGGCAIPQGAEGTDKLLEALQRLDGFDNEAVIQAMASTADARFVCWKRKAQA